jgi:hypothetical protein
MQTVGIGKSPGSPNLHAFFARKNAQKKMPLADQRHLAEFDLTGFSVERFSIAKRIVEPRRVFDLRADRSLKLQWFAALFARWHSLNLRNLPSVRRP